MTIAAPRLSRRHVLAGAAILAAGLGDEVRAQTTRVWQDQNYSFPTKSLDGWTVVSGQWAVEEVPGALSGKALVQRATGNAFNVILAPDGPWTEVTVAVRFKPISGREDASCGIVLRYEEGRYYVVRANALEGNFRLYYYDRGRFEIASADVAAPALGQWHRMRIAAAGDRMQAWLNDRLLLDHRDRRFAAGRVGLWTKADAVTAFDDLTIGSPE